MKTCSICKTSKNETEYGPKGKNKDGSVRLEARCKECKNRQNREKYEQRKDEINARRGELRNQDIEAYNAYQRERYWANRDANVERMRKRYHSNPEARARQAARVKKYRAENPEWWREYHRQKQAEWREKNPEKVKAYSKVHKAKKSGQLKPPKYCQLCWEKKPLEAHHEDYIKALDVMWLCKGCHEKFTRTAKLAAHAKKREQ